jgi:hypothetical protein
VFASSLLLLAWGASESAAPGSVSIDNPQQGTAIRSYAGWAGWADLDGATQTLVVRAPDGTVTPTTVQVTESRDPDGTVHNYGPEPIAFNLGPGPRGDPTLAFASCPRPGTCAIDTEALPSGPVLQVPGTQSGVAALSVAIWRSELAWSFAGSAVDVRLHPGSPVRTVRPWAARQCVSGPPCGRFAQSVTELALHGRLLASVDRFVGGNTDQLTVKVGLLDLNNGRRDSVQTINPGELSGKTLLAPAFPTARSVEWMDACSGDQGGCLHDGGVYGYDLRTHAITYSPLTGMHDGWAPLGGRQILESQGDSCSVLTCALLERTLRPWRTPR